ncbi:hypothetical protein ABVT39_002521, partial [Epinephelus coioides]
MQTLAANSKAATAFSPELWRDVAPCNLPSVRARRAVCPAFLRLPTATHESFGHSCSRWGKMSPRWQSVLCVSVRLSFLPHKRVLLLYKRPESHPRGNVGKTTAGWRGTYGCSLTVCECTFAAHRAAGMHWTCVCVHACTCTNYYCGLKAQRPQRQQQKEFYNLCNRQIASAAPHICCVMQARYSSKGID